MNRKVQDVRRELAADERGGTEFDGIAQYIVKPEVLETRFRGLGLPGTAVKYGGTVCLHLYFGLPRLVPADLGSADPRLGFLVYGRQK